MKAILYARYSTERQSESSIADQLRVCREYAQRLGWCVAAEYSDEGISGAALGNRPGVLGAMDALGAGDVLLVVDLSRLSRSQDLAPLLTRLRHRGARVVGVQDGFDSDSRTARMQAGLSGIMSEEFRAMIADRTHSAQELRARAGKRVAGKAFEDVETVREIFSRFAAGEAMRAIASDLNRRGIPSPGAAWKARARPRGHWQISTLHAMLHNERYIGRLIWNQSRWVKDPDTGARRRVERPASEWVVTECDRIIDQDVWDAVQARFTTQHTRGGVARWLLSGILECAECGGKLVITGGRQHRYICGTFHNAGPHACANRKTFPRAVAEDLILAPVVDDLLSPAAIEGGVALLRQERVRPEPQELPDREVAELERLVKAGVLSPEVAAPSLAEARRKAQARRRAEPVRQSVWPTEKAWRDAVANMREILTGPNVIAARTILARLIGPVRCRPVPEGVLAEMTTRHILLATTPAAFLGTGTDGMVSGFESGPRYQSKYRSVLIPTSTRKRGGGR